MSSISLWWRMPFMIHRTSRILNQRLYPLDPEELIRPFVPREFQKFLQDPFDSIQQQQQQQHVQQLKYDKNECCDTNVSLDKDGFQANLDVQQFKPDEISVKIIGNNTISVEGKHEEKPENGFISRHFVRQYVLPHGHDVSKIELKLSSDGILTITAPKLQDYEDSKRIPITETGEPARKEKKTKE